MNDNFTEFRKDGWPLCPRCQEDELCSLYLLTDHAMARSMVGEIISVEECLRYPFRCYQCDWRNDAGAPLAALIAITTTPTNSSPSP
jgi:hypothetical protein